ncbi:hypothetical protein AAW14_04265 [Streptomyces hygroscopicus]|nr:hypothetical protein [Streptomyces hygroscopicus]
MFGPRQRAVALMRTPSPLNPWQALGPSFEYMPPQKREQIRQEIASARQLPRTIRARTHVRCALFQPPCLGEFRPIGIRCSLHHGERFRSK